ncbi:MAG TPA: RNA polymerase sigma factor [Vicinamibacterales bacterium]|nr:RNA polymerase sigma factor [Vicinamibacterales bacterium]
MDFERLAAAHKDAVYRQLIRTCGNREDAEDALVEALLRAYRHLDQLREDDAFRAWLAQIGRRVCWHLKARDALVPVIQLSALEDRGEGLVDPAPAPDAALAKQRLRDLLQQAVDELDPAHRAVYELRDLEGYSGRETAERLGISIAAQKSRLHRARTQVRAALDRQLAGSGHEAFRTGARLRRDDRAR